MFNLNLGLSFSIILIGLVTAREKQSFFEAPYNHSFKPKSGKLKANIAIIGAGAGGSSAAYFLAKEQLKLGHKVTLDVDVFERDDRVGGRVYHALVGEKKYKYELGATSIVGANYYLMNASKEFDIEFESGPEDGPNFGLYNGKSFVARLDSSYLNKAYFYYKYGWGFFQANRLSAQLRDQFLDIYSPSRPPYDTVEGLLGSLGLLNYLDKTISEVLENEWHVGKGFVDEMLQAITRNIYTIDNSLHALAGAVALAGISGSYTTKYGNSKIFEQYLNHSLAKVHLSSKVTKIVKQTSKSGKPQYWLDINGIALNKKYDYVILASPLHLSNIQFKNITIDFDQVPYQNVYLTLIQEAQLDPSFFHVKSQNELPNNILGFDKNLPYTTVHHNKEARIVEISSNRPLTSIELEQLLVSTPRKENIIQKGWLAYPVMRPLPKTSKPRFPPIKVDDQIYYINAIEPAISCMEVETISAMNIVKLLLKSFLPISENSSN